ncbi:DNA polymerase III subunit beta [Rhizobium azibense]|uniref:Beta sliding clamp n=1 Tax=Rhizobium azibense TaxID=1136135 RepID=A0A4R3RGC1_9HYPH|nr:DNA polymerase III subunit beta [Rhizobium azibense]TCU34051.1 DNA polymerase III beta subunit [Rhizobium azibense]
MKFSIEKSVIAKAIAHASRIVEKRSTIPILANVVLRADGAELSLRTTDLDLEASLTIPADVDVAGATTVPATLLSDIVRKLAGDTVSFVMEAGGDSIMVGAGRSKFKLQCLPEHDMPDLNVGAFSHDFTMPAAHLKKLIGRTQFAISTEETRYYLNGIFMHAADELGRPVLRAVATDGHRLARVDVEQPHGASGMPGIIIPRKTVGEFDKILEAGDVTVEVSDTKIRLTAGTTVITSKLIDGTFPQYEKVIPTTNNKVAIADATAIKASTDRVATVSSERGKAVKMTFSAGNLHLFVSNPDMGNAEDDVEIDYDADDLDIGFNARYINDILNNIDSKRARIILGDAGSPAIIRDEEGDDTLFILMPMRV